MAYQVTTISPEGETCRFEYEKTPPNSMLKDWIGGGWLEIVPEFTDYGGKPCVVFCDEEGKAKGLPVNPRATYLWYACLAPHPFRPDTLNGPIVIVTAGTAAELGAL